MKPFIAATMLIAASAAFATEKYSIWSACSSGTSGNITDLVAKDTTRLVATCSNKDIIASPDGVTWTRVYTAKSAPSNLVIAHGMFCACADTCFLSSIDGVSWSSSTIYGANPNVAVPVCGLT